MSQDIKSQDQDQDHNIKSQDQDHHRLIRLIPRPQHHVTRHQVTRPRPRPRHQVTRPRPRPWHKVTRPRHDKNAWRLPRGKKLSRDLTYITGNWLDNGTCHFYLSVSLDNDYYTDLDDVSLLAPTTQTSTTTLKSLREDTIISTRFLTEDECPESVGAGDSISSLTVSNNYGHTLRSRAIQIYTYLPTYLLTYLLTYTVDDSHVIWVFFSVYPGSLSRQHTRNDQWYCTVLVTPADVNQTSSDEKALPSPPCLLPGRTF